jgi:hypothetical protein
MISYPVPNAPAHHQGAKNLDMGTGLWWRVRSAEHERLDKEDLWSRPTRIPEFAMTHWVRGNRAITTPWQHGIRRNIYQERNINNLVFLKLCKNIIFIEQHVGVHLPTRCVLSDLSISTQNLGMTYRYIGVLQFCIGYRPPLGLRPFIQQPEPQCIPI